MYTVLYRRVNRTNRVCRGQWCQVDPLRNNKNHVHTYDTSTMIVRTPRLGRLLLPTVVITTLPPPAMVHNSAPPLCRTLHPPGLRELHDRERSRYSGTTPLLRVETLSGAFEPIRIGLHIIPYPPLYRDHYCMQLRVFQLMDSGCEHLVYGACCFLCCCGCNFVGFQKQSREWSQEEQDRRANESHLGNSRHTNKKERKPTRRAIHPLHNNTR